MSIYNYYVDLGKGLINKIEGHQVLIAGYAVAVCDIRHGGKSSGYYTLTNYAKDIGMNKKTLQNWVQAYRNVVIKLDRPVLTKEEWSAVRRTNDILTMDVTIKNKISGIKGKKKTINTPKERVQKIYDEVEIEEKPFTLELTRCLQAAKNIKFLMSTRDISIGEIKPLTALMELLDESSDLINDNLTKRVNRSKEQLH